MLLSSSVEKSHLDRVIDSLRKEMIQTGIKEGLTSKKTIALSQKLDEYIARWILLWR
ncbi:aspartyl-phosphate phosphatase Spo0E family protein [Bacillus salipaludis]|uniref:aspartyl-phosphate phosphatase Spo0E family protein n=1 Tax=Bacillus salipaludis TaxID=2547811 RepID=UPI002E24177A|nr:aspartyl-phosphate phosphatase Spo0E family protein [Bacillus salipaludis]